MLVFISYDQAGDAIFKSLAKSLREVGVEVLAAGRATTLRANKSLQKADALVVLLSAGVLKSPRMRSRALWFHTVAQDQPAKHFIPVWVEENPELELWPFLTPEMVMTRDLPEGGDDALVRQILAKLGITPLPITKPLITPASAAAAGKGRRNAQLALATSIAVVASVAGIGLTLARGHHSTPVKGQTTVALVSPTATKSIPSGVIVPTAAVSTTSTTTPSLSPTTAPTATATPVPYTLLLAINAGGKATGPFSGDVDYSGGGAFAVSEKTHIDLSKAQSPAPQGVYQSERYGVFTYTIANLTAGHMYKVRLHFAEIYFVQNGAGQRVFNVAINGQPVLTNFDIYQDAGGADIADVKEFLVQPNSKGQIIIDFEQGAANWPKVSGIEIYQ